MPLPRFTDSKTGLPYELALFCHKCGWAVAKDRITENWKTCRHCESDQIKTIRINYASSKT